MLCSGGVKNDLNANKYLFIYTMEAIKDNIICHSNYFSISSSFASHLLNLSIPFEKSEDDNVLHITRTNYVDLYGILFPNDLENLYEYPVPLLKVWKTHPDAVVPRKNNESDVGFDLTVIKVSKQLSDNVFLFDTGIKLQVPLGYYIEVVPRSSLSKSGWMLANSVGIIDNSYTGNIYVALVKIEELAKPIQLPFKGFQLIIRRQYGAYVREMTEETQTTIRGDGGFGSSDK